MTFKRWLPTFVAFPVGGELAIATLGSLDGPLRAAAGGLIVGVAVGAAQGLALGSRVSALRWAAYTAAAIVGAMALAAAVAGAGTTPAGVVLIGSIVGAAVGGAQSRLLDRGRGAAATWVVVNAMAWALGWLTTSAVIVDLERGYYAFGASGALVVTVITGLSLRRLLGEPVRAASRSVGRRSRTSAPLVGASSGSRFGPQRLADYATRRPKRVLASWFAVVLVSLGLIATLLGSGLTSDGKLTNNPESYRAQALVDAGMPGSEPPDEVVVVRSERHVVSDPAFESRVGEFVAEARRGPGVAQITSYLDRGAEGLVSDDRHAVVLPVMLGDADGDTAAELVALVERFDRSGDFVVDITGDQTLSADLEALSASDLSKGELQFGLPAALLVLLLVVGTVAGAAVPMVMALVSIVVALGVTAVIGQVFEVNLFILNMVVAMGLALGIDYSLFILSRLREERQRGSDTRDAILTVANTATRAVVFSGTAFVLAMVAMLLVPDSTLRSLGLGAVIVGVVSIAVALTFHPALLMVLGDRVERLRVPWIGRRVAATAGDEGPVWRRAVIAVTRRPVLSLAATTALLLALAIPVVDLRMGDGGTSALPDDTVAKQGLVALERDFPSGATDPVTVVVDGPADGAGVEQGLARLRARLDRDRAFAAAAFSVERAPRLVVASVPLTVERSSGRASAAVDRLRDEHIPRAFGASADRVLVGGAPAEARDAFAVNAGWLPVVIAVVLVLSLALLTLAFRSIAIPLTAVAVNLLSVGAAYGVLVLVFQKGVGADLLGFTEVERIDAWVPIFLFSVLFGLSMDYQVFLLSRIRERWSATGDTTEAVVHGVSSTARLITGAAAIIIVVFSGFATGQLVAFQEMGFGIAVALALDATLVRLLLIPAAMRLLGERNWYLPRWLGWLPEVQIEGARPEAPPAVPIPVAPEPVTATREEGVPLLA